MTLTRAVWPAAAGGPEVLRLEYRTIPSPARNQVLIQVAAAGVNRHDCLQRRRGTPPQGATDILGLEVAGTVVALGQGVSTHAVGDRVCALVNGGGYAEYCAADAALTLPMPDGLNAVQAAALPEALFTFWLSAVHLGRLRSNEWLLIHGGASGIGTLAIQLARHLGARVAVTARSEAKLAACARLGASVLINYQTQDFVQEIHEATSGRGVDVILDMVGGAYGQRNVDALAPDGRVVHLTSQQKRDLNIDLQSLMAKRAIITGSMLRAYPRKHELAADLLDRVWPLMGKRINPVIDQIFPLVEVQAAHRRMESGEHIGKIMLAVAEDQAAFGA